MGTKSSAGGTPRFPPEHGGIQVNFCKNPRCSNYGVPPRPLVGRWQGTPDTYHLSGTGRFPAAPVLACKSCGEFPPLKSNAAIAEERDRLLKDIAIAPEPGCPDPRCSSHQVPVSADKIAYQSFGKTRSGSRRYRCKTCHKTFAVGSSTTGHKQPHKNREVFALLMNKSPFRRICEVADIDPKTLYGKIAFLHGQCLAFAADREKKLVDGLPMERLYLSTDRQDYVVNWTRQDDRRNVVLHATGTADNTSGYVFGVHLNYDPTLDAQEIERAAIKCGDYSVPLPHRRHARCWLKGDYDAARGRQRHRRGLVTRTGLQAEIEASYNEALARDDVEASEVLDAGRRLPTKGMQVHSEYALYGHFFYLRRLLGGVEKVRFFLDQDSGMRAACLAAFQPEIVARRADAFYVRVAKDMTINQKRAAVSASREQLAAARKAHRGLSDSEIEVVVTQQRIAGMASIGKWQDKWLSLPFPTMSEPEKAACWLTDYGDYPPGHLARLYNRASLHGIDRFFMQVRRRLSLLERPIATASSARRIWHGYSAYNPETIVKMLGIFRVFYNFCLVGKDGQTQAMRLGLAKGRTRLEDIIYFS